MNTIKYPYPELRKGQLEISEAVGAQLRSGGTLLIEAPSGFGKTAAIVAGITTIAGEKSYRVYYVCRTKREIARVMEELHRFLQVCPIEFSFMVPRFELCLKRHEEPQPITHDMFKSYCDFQIANRLCHYFETTFNYTERELSEGISSNASSPLQVLGWLKEKKVCPYEALNLVAENSGVVLMTYSHFLQTIFRQLAYPGTDPLPSRQNYKLVGIFDEAHNLPDLLSSHFDMQMAYSEFRTATELASEIGAEHLANIIARIAAIIAEIWNVTNSKGAITGSQLLDQLYMQISRTELFTALQQLTLASERIWAGIWHRNFDVQRFAGLLSFNDLVSFLFSVDSLNLGEGVMVTPAGNTADPGVSVEVADPSLFFPHLASKFHCKVFLSATLGSPTLFLERLGLKPTDSSTISVSAQGLQKPVLCLVDEVLTTRWSSRTSEMFDKIVRRLLVFCRLIPRGVGVFASSYPILRHLTEGIKAHDRNLKLYVERERTSLEEASKVIEGFKQEVSLGGRPILIGVQGGRFAEGEDFGEYDMQGIAVVGLSFQRPTSHLLEKMRFLKSRWQNPGRLLLTEPAVTRAVQSVGRGMRGSKAKLIVYLADYRFSYPSVKQLLPKWITENWVQGDFFPEKMEKTILSFGLT